MTPLDGKKQYLANQVLTASPVELVRMLYERAVQAVEDARTALRSGDILARGKAIGKAIEILSELRLSLRRDVFPEYCDTLGGLYGYLQRQLARAHSEQSESLLQEVSRLLQTLLEGWTTAIQSLSATQDADSKLAAEPQPAVTASNPYSEEPAPQPARNRSWQL